MERKYQMQGEWNNEPDAEDFEHAGLKCAIRRNGGGAWCGYVAVPKDHPWHGKGYSDQVKVNREIIEREINLDKIGVINLLCASGKGDSMAEGFIDIVLAIDVHGGLTYSGDKWPLDGEWCFGFDCSHAGDFSPKYAHSFRDDVYRNHEYVKNETQSLAEQLMRFGQLKLTKATGEQS